MYCKIQCAKKVLYDSPGLVDFPVGLVDSICHLPDVASDALSAEVSWQKS